MSIIFWGLLGLILFITDALTSMLLLLGFAISSILTMLLCTFIPLYLEIIIFLVVGISISLYIVPKLKKVVKVNNYEENLIGTTFISTQSMIGGRVYQEKVKGTYWNIVSNEDVSLNVMLKVIKIDKEKNILIVRGEN